MSKQTCRLVDVAVVNIILTFHEVFLLETTKLYHSDITFAAHLHRTFDVTSKMPLHESYVQIKIIKHNNAYHIN